MVYLACEKPVQTPQNTPGGSMSTAKIEQTLAYDHETVVFRRSIAETLSTIVFHGARSYYTHASIGYCQNYVIFSNSWCLAATAQNY